MKRLDYTTNLADDEILLVETGGGRYVLYTDYAKDVNARLDAVLRLAIEAIKVDGSLLTLLQDVRKLRVIS